jgi:hypothetical protein
MDNQWVPFGMSNEEASEYAVLVDGVPGRLRNSLLSWIMDNIGFDQGLANTGICLDIQLHTAIDLGAEAGSLTPAEDVIGLLNTLNGLELLRIADFQLSNFGASPYASGLVQSLDRMLAAASSRWKVGTRAGNSGLEERVPEGVQDAVEGVIAESGSAGRMLARAWAHVHGFQPDASAGYAMAVRAVEIAAQPVVEPKNKSATLGTMIAVMRQNGDWRLPLREHDHAPGPEMLVNNLRTLWHGHRDRHGTADYSDVTLDEARAAVGLCAVLVDWFSAGLIERKSV